MASTINYHNGIIAVDANYVRPGLAAIHLLLEGDRVAVIDTGVNNSVAGVLSALAEYRISPEQLEWIILTHIHLDHAGGTGALLRHFPGARVLVHPRGARHLADPEKLIAGTVAVYGAEQAAHLYGTIEPVPAERIVEAQHEQKIRLGSRELLLLHTPGHALHHICIVDERTGHIFSGDTFGISYRELDKHGRQFMFATTTPVHFDPAALHASIDLLCAFQPEAIYLTHFSQVRNIPLMATQLKACIDAHVAVAESSRGKGIERINSIKAGLARWVEQASLEQDWKLQGRDAVKLLAGDIDLNAQGLAVWLDRRERD